MQLEQEKEQEQIELARLAAIEQGIHLALYSLISFTNIILAEKEQKEIEKLAEQGIIRHVTYYFKYTDLIF